MSKRRVKFSVLFFLLPLVTLCFAACTSLPVPESDNDSLLVLNVKQDREGNHDIMLDFWLYFNDGTKTRINFKGDENQQLIRKDSFGPVQTIKIRAAVKPGVSGGVGKSFWDVPFRAEVNLEKGAYTVFPVTLVYKEIMAKASGSYSWDIDVEKIDHDKMDEIVASMEERGVHEYWKKPEYK